MRGHLEGVSEPGMELYAKRLMTLALHAEGTPIPSTFVAFVDDRPVGSSSLVYYQFTAQQQRTEWLTNIFVLPEYRNQGIGEELVSHACDFAKSQGVSRLRLYTSDKSAFYQKLGWERVGTSHVQGKDVDLLARVFVGS